MDNFQKDIDDRANLTLSNRFELLLFRLGTSLNENKSELFGINVFKLREIVPMPTFTKPAGMKSPLMGMVNIRDRDPGDRSGRRRRLQASHRAEHPADHRICPQRAGVCCGIGGKHHASGLEAGACCGNCRQRSLHYQHCLPGREDGYQRSGDGAGRGADPVRHHPGEPRSARHPSGNHQI